MAEGSKGVVYAALAGNLAIAVTKFVAFGLTRSTAMLTEAIHSLVDTGDQLLLLVGMRRAARPPDASHPFGYGMEVYFWAFIVALLIFALGGLVSIYEGVERILHPEPASKPWINYAVLGASFLFEGYSFTVGWREYKRVAPAGVGVTRFVKRSKDPTLFATLLEDSAALTGLVIAALGVTGAMLGIAWADGAASVGIGLLLMAVAAILGNETRSLIAGEGAVASVTEEIRRRLAGDPRITAVERLRSLHLGPDTILVAADLGFRPDLDREGVGRAFQDLTRAVQEADPRVRDVFLRSTGAEPSPEPPVAG